MTHFLHCLYLIPILFIQRYVDAKSSLFMVYIKLSYAAQLCVTALNVTNQIWKILGLFSNTGRLFRLKGRVEFLQWCFGGGGGLICGDLHLMRSEFVTKFCPGVTKDSWPATVTWRLGLQLQQTALQGPSKEPGTASIDNRPTCVSYCKSVEKDT